MNGTAGRRVGPHVFRHATAVHLLEAGVEVNVIRAWLGHVNLATTNRYADINIRTKVEAIANFRGGSVAPRPIVACAKATQGRTVAFDATRAPQDRRVAVRCDRVHRRGQPGARDAKHRPI